MNEEQRRQEEERVRPEVERWKENRKRISEVVAPYRQPIIDRLPINDDFFLDQLNVHLDSGRDGFVFAQDDIHIFQGRVLLPVNEKKRKTPLNLDEQKLFSELMNDVANPGWVTLKHSIIHITSVERVEILSNGKKYVFEKDHQVLCVI